MSAERRPTVGVVVPAYNGRADLARCLESLRASTYQPLALVVVDNASADGTVDFVRQQFPEVTLLLEETNTGYAAACNRGWAALQRRGVAYLALINQDVTVEPGWAEPLIRYLEEHPDATAAQPLILRADERRVINSVGNRIHFLGFGYAALEGVSLDDSRAQRYLKAPSEVTYASGAAMVVRAEHLTELGLFEGNFFMYHEDLDLGWRIRLAGYRSVLVPSAAAYHRYEFQRSRMIKYGYGERNRLLVLLENYHLLTLLLIFPAWLTMEVGVVTFSLIGGWFLEKLEGYRYVALHLPEILDTRRRHQALRRRPEREVAGVFSGGIYYQAEPTPLLALANPLFRLYWAAVRRLIVW